MKIKAKDKFFIALAAFLLFPLAVSFAAETGESFFIESPYDYWGREKIEADLVLTTDYIHFYIDSRWWEDLEGKEQEKNKEVVRHLGEEFKNNIYPGVTESFGSIPKHDVVGEKEKVYVLFHPMKDGSGGYFRTGDQYSIYQYSRSNEKNILYLNADFMERANLPGYLAHEFIHLVTFNEKNKEFGISEEIWLNELRAEVIITILGYDDHYEGSNLMSRVNGFLRDPDFSLTEWTEQAADYGVANVFGQYLLDHYGKEILSDSLQMGIAGIPSLDYALEKNGFDKTFSQVFTEWTLAVYLNDCSYGEYYCFKNENLKNMRVRPVTVRSEGPVSIEYKTKNWAGNWHRIEGGEGVLYLEFQAEERFAVPYVLCRKEGDCDIYFFDFDEKKEGSVLVEEFGTEYQSLTILPSLQQKFAGFNGPERTFTFNWRAEIGEKKEEIKEEIRERELAEMRDLLLTIRERLLLFYERAGRVPPTGVASKKIESNLYYGITGSKEVETLQKVLKKEGTHIYPEGLVTGNFLELTKKAVIRFQEYYKEEILVPLGLSEGTGYVGERTRSFVNNLLRKTR